MERDARRIKIHSKLSVLPWRSCVKALRYALRKKVEKHVFLPSGRYFYVVKGDSGEHMVSGNTCSCLDHYLNVMVRGRRELCHHIVAVTISNDFGKLIIVEHNDNELPGFVKKLMNLEDIINKFNR